MKLKKDVTDALWALADYCSGVTCSDCFISNIGFCNCDNAMGVDDISKQLDIYRDAIQEELEEEHFQLTRKE